MKTPWWYSKVIIHPSMALAENHRERLVLAKTKRKAQFLAAPYQGILVWQDPGGPCTIHDGDDGV